jgi:hypothetical protein
LIDHQRSLRRSLITASRPRSEPKLSRRQCSLYTLTDDGPTSVADRIEHHGRIADDADHAPGSDVLKAQHASRPCRPSQHGITGGIVESTVIGMMTPLMFPWNVICFVVLAIATVWMFVEYEPFQNWLLGLKNRYESKPR